LHNVHFPIESPHAAYSQHPIIDLDLWKDQENEENRRPQLRIRSLKRIKKFIHKVLSVSPKGRKLKCGGRLSDVEKSINRNETIPCRSDHIFVDTPMPSHWVLQPDQRDLFMVDPLPKTYDQSNVCTVFKCTADICLVNHFVGSILFARPGLQNSI
jgi:hypothetical protein